VHKMENVAKILGRVSDLPRSGMREVEVNKKKILLVRQDNEITALGATCPHAGAPLAEGVLVDGQIICPWHKAAFCTRTGKRIDPPAVDDLEVFSINVQDGNIVLIPARAPEVAPRNAEDARHFIVLGAGAAGFSAAQTLRESGFNGAVTLISSEADLPYDRTILSKYVLAGQAAGEKSPLQDDDFYKTKKIKRYKAEVLDLDPEKRRITLSDGQTLTYDAALIATGGMVIPPPFSGGNLTNVFTLRSQTDAQQIVQAAARSRRAVVIGASFIGMEAAAALRERGLDVTVVAMERAPFERPLGADIGNVYRQIHEEKGVAFRFGAYVERIHGETKVDAVILKDGERLEADLVVAGLGVRPATNFVKAMTREDDHALIVDEHLRISSELYAAGDAAAFPLYGDGPLVRIEHWRLAEQQGRLAARNMLGFNETFVAVPYFWTIQYMIKLDYVGHATGEDELVIRGDLGERRFIAYYLRDGVVAAAAGMDQEQDMAAIIALMSQHQGWKLDELHPQHSSPVGTLKAVGLAHAMGRHGIQPPIP
jgi:apoptosis-inducing factor 3